MSSTRRLRWAALVTASTAAVALAACGGGSSSDGATSSGSPSATDAARVVKIKVADAGVANVLLVAKAKGYFSKYHLDPSLTQTQSGVATLAALRGGSLDIGYADLYAGINAISNGFDVQLVANNNTNLTSLPVLVKADGPVKAVTDLAGKTIGVSPVPQFVVNTRGFLQANGVDPDSVKFSVIADSTGAPQALQRGDYTAWPPGSWTPVYANDGATGYHFTTVGNPSTSAWSNPKATTAGFFSTGKYARDNPQVERDFAAALWDFHKWWNGQSPTDQAALIKQYYNVDYAKIAGGDTAKLKNLLPTYYQTGPIDLAATQSWYELGLKYAGDKIAAKVDWQSHVFESAKQPAPTG